MKNSTDYFYITPPQNLIEELLRVRETTLKDEPKCKKKFQYYSRDEKNPFIAEYYQDFLTKNRLVFFNKSKEEIQVSITPFWKSSLNWKSSLEIGFTLNSNLFDEETKQIIEDKNRMFFINFYSNPDFLKEAKEGKIRVTYLYEYKYFCDIELVN
jgi:hypothetical protein